MIVFSFNLDRILTFPQLIYLQFSTSQDGVALRSRIKRRFCKKLVIAGTTGPSFRYSRTNRHEGMTGIDTDNSTDIYELSFVHFEMSSLVAAEWIPYQDDDLADFEPPARMIFLVSKQSHYQDVLVFSDCEFLYEQ